MMSQYFITIIKFDYIQKDEYIFQETNKYKNLMKLRNSIVQTCTLEI